MVSPGVRLSLAILDRLSQSPGGMGFSRLRRALPGATASALSRQLHALAELGWVEGGRERPWRCGPSFQSAAERLSRGPDIGAIVQPTVEALALATSQSAAMVTFAGDGFVFRAKHELPDSFHYLGVGQKNTNLTTHPFGIVCLAFLSPEERTQLTGSHLDPELGRSIQHVRERGWLSGVDAGLRICAPVLRADGLFAGVIGVSFMNRGMGEREIVRIAATVRRFAREAGIRIS